MSYSIALKKEDIAALQEDEQDYRDDLQGWIGLTYFIEKETKHLDKHRQLELYLPQKEISGLAKKLFDGISDIGELPAKIIPDEKNIPPIKCVGFIGFYM